MPFVPGENVGPYRILEQLGQGGMATVYKAYHASLDRYVALKVLIPVFLEDPTFLARFQREARLLARLEHPNIIPIHDCAEEDGLPYLVMKFVEGETLKARLARQPLLPVEAWKIVAAVGAALAYAHSFNILHRDVKPSNIILEKGGHVYLADFGLARMAESSTSTLTGDMIVGTPQYISPEQAIGSTELTAATDIYSLGVILYELSAGRVPFDADTPVAIIQHHIQSPLPLPRSIDPAISPALERVLLKALAKNPADRYQDVAALVEAFRAAWQTQFSGQMGFPCLKTQGGKRFPLPAGAHILGRQTEGQSEPVAIDLGELDTNKVVSRHHARIDVRAGGITLTDLGSRNGTTRNGQRLNAHVPTALQDGDVIGLGKEGVLLTLEIETS